VPAAILAGRQAVWRTAFPHTAVNDSDGFGQSVYTLGGIGRAFKLSEKSLKMGICLNSDPSVVKQELHSYRYLEQFII